jgi:GR25 family glycosyltransferase involved in LPS biosynthesis
MDKVVLFTITVLSVCGLVLFTQKEQFQNDILSDSEAYVINLPKRKERLDNFMKSFNSSDVSSIKITIIKAVDGSDPTQIEGFAPESTKRVIKTGKRSNNEDLTPGMIGCYLSHYKVYEEFLKSGKSFAFVFEDDAELKNTIGKNLSDLPENWDILSLGIQNCFNCPEHNDKFTKTHDFYGTAGYIISRKGAMKMIENREKEITLQIDGLIGKFTREGKINGYSVKQNLVEAKWFGTDIQQSVG